MAPSLLHRPTAVLLLPLLAACSLGEGSGVRTTQRDSAGIVIVENEGTIPADGGGWTIAPEPSLIIGTVEGEDVYQFYGIAGVARFDDGRIATVDYGSRQVRIYGPDGVFQRAFGQRGGGPEEFEMPVLAGVVDNTLLVVDRAHHRITWVHPDRGFVGLVRVSDDVGGFLNPAGTFANGEAVFGGAFDMRRIGERRNGMNRANTFYRSCGPDGELAADFGDKDGAEYWIQDLEAEGPESRPVLTPFARVPMATVSPTRFYFSSQDSYEIQGHDTSGRLVRLIRLERDPIPVTPEDGARYVEEVAAEAGNPEQAAALRAQLSSLPLPAVFPPHGRILADRLGYLWVEEYQRPGEEDRAWNVFDPEGAWTARLTLPERFSPMEIGADYLLGTGWDDLNVEYVVLHGLTRQGR